MTAEKGGLAARLASAMFGGSVSNHVADPESPNPRPHHYMNADGTCHTGDLFEQGGGHVVLYSAEELVRIVNAERAEAQAQHREEWADYLSGWMGAVGPVPPTVELVVAALRGPVPFGRAAGTPVPAPARDADTEPEEGQ